MKLFDGRSRRLTPTSVSVVDNRMTLRGDIDTDGIVRVDGRVEGTTHRAGTLIVGSGGFVVGDVEAREVVVAGRVNGNIMARGRVEIDTGGAVRGDIRASSMSLHEGGAVEGTVSVGVPAPAAANGPRLELSPATPIAGQARG